MTWHSELGGSVWAVQSVRADGVMVPVVTGARRAVIRFDDDARFSGSTGCNNFFGQFTEVDGGLVSGPIGTTMMMCPDALMVQERRLLTALEATRGIVVDRGMLALIDGGGATLVEAVASDEGDGAAPR